ncbi:MAG: preprotein translocase subunit SecG [Oscillospiraceae bacterium]|nr:preprotein translocase subunit SecG [Oscillospiraceae bacterium]
MTTVQLVLSIVMVVVGLILMLIVLLQSGKNAGMSGVITGNNSDSFLSRNKSKSMDAKLARVTKWVAIAFMVLSMIMCLI